MTPPAPLPVTKSPHQGPERAPKALPYNSLGDDLTKLKELVGGYIYITSTLTFLVVGERVGHGSAHP